MQLGNAVDEAAEQLRRFMRMAVPALVSRPVVEAEVGAEVDERDAAIEDRSREPLAVPVRQRSEDQVDIRRAIPSNFSKAASG